MHSLQVELLEASVRLWKRVYSKIKGKIHCFYLCSSTNLVTECKMSFSLSELISLKQCKCAALIFDEASDDFLSKPLSPHER